MRALGGKPLKDEAPVFLIDVLLERMKRGEAELSLENDSAIRKSKLLQATGRPRHDWQYLAPGKPQASFLVPQIDAVASLLDLPLLGD